MSRLRAGIIARQVWGQRMSLPFETFRESTCSPWLGHRSLPPAGQPIILAYRGPWATSVSLLPCQRTTWCTLLDTARRGIANVSVHPEAVK